MKRLPPLVALLAILALHANPSHTVEQELIEIDDEWRQAYVRGDTAALERIEHPGFVYTDSAGAVTGKAEDIAALKSGAFKLRYCRGENVKVHMFGDTAVITGHEIQQGISGGRDVSGKFAYTATFIRRSGRWQAAAIQFAKLK